jgi:cytochrome P450
LRKGAWFRVGPAARALIDAALLYLRRGGRIKSPALLEALRRAAEEVLRLTTPVRVLARAAKSIATNSHRYISITT